MSPFDRLSIIKSTDLWLNLGVTEVLKGIELEVHSGEILCIIGPGGQGKTVLLKTLAGLYSPQKGQTRLFDTELDTLDKLGQLALKRKVAMTFQRSGLFDSLTALENILFPLEECNELTGQEAITLAKEALNDVGLAGQEDTFPHELSGGMQKRLGIARALALKPKLILYDDPTAGLDPVTSRSIIQLILKEKKQGDMTLMISTSDVDLAFDIASLPNSRIGFLHDGTFRKIGTKKELRESTDTLIQQFIHGNLVGPLQAND